MKKLIIFDVDGTLTNTMDIDTDCFIKAVNEVYPDFIISTDWDSYQNATDTGFLIEIFEKNLSRKPAKDEVSKIKSRFIRLLSAVFNKNHSQCTPIPGAEQIFNKLRQCDWHAAIATGCWKESALMKLQLANIPYLSIPIAHGDDGIKRHDIIKCAVAKACQKYNILQFDKIVYIGDRFWDHVAAKKAEIDFIGIGSIFKNVPEIFRINNYIDEDLLNHINL